MNWISVNERLPVKDCTVLVAVDQRVAIADWYVKDGWSISREDSAMGMTSNTVTHWMPLPDPPEAENDVFG